MDLRPLGIFNKNSGVSLRSYSKQCKRKRPLSIASFFLIVLFSCRSRLPVCKLNANDSLDCQFTKSWSYLLAVNISWTWIIRFIKEKFPNKSDSALAPFYIWFLKKIDGIVLTQQPIDSRDNWKSDHHFNLVFFLLYCRRFSYLKELHFFDLP